MDNIQITGRGFEKASSKLTSEQLDRPIDEVVAPSEEVAPSESVPETPVETVSEPEVSTPEPEEEKVPKSRFLTMAKRAIETEKAARAYVAERESRPAFGFVCSSCFFS